MFRFGFATVLVVLFFKSSLAKVGGCFNDRCAPTKKKLASMKPVPVASNTQMLASDVHASL